MQTAIVLIIVAAAAFFLVKRFYNSIRKADPSNCGCGCSGCHSIQSCADPVIAPDQTGEQTDRRDKNTYKPSQKNL